MIQLSANIDDTGFNNNNGAEPTQLITAAEVFIDIPPWETSSSPVGIPFQAVDGSFDNRLEAVAVTLDTSNLSAGKHTLFVRGQDASDSWGPVSAVFLELESFEALLMAWPNQASVLDLIPLI